MSIASRVRALLAALVVAALVGVAPAPAAAHGELVAASPGFGEVVGTVVHIDLVFTTELFDWTLTVEKPDKTPLDGSAVQKAPPYLSFETPPLTEEGQYIVRYSGVDTDGDVLEGAYAFTFEVGAPKPAPLGVDFSALEDDNPAWWYYALLMAGVVVVALLAGLLAEKYRRLRMARA